MLRTVLGPLFISLLCGSVILTGCDEDPTGTGDKDNTGDTVSLPGDGSIYHVRNFVEGAPGTSFPSDTSDWSVGVSVGEFDGEESVRWYGKNAGFILADAWLFQGRLPLASSDPERLYIASGNPFSSSPYWSFDGWVSYPITGTGSATTLLDSTNASGTQRQQVVWSAESKGTRSVEYNSGSYTANVVAWNLAVTRWKDGDVEIILEYVGEDEWVASLGYPVVRRVEDFVDGRPTRTSIARLMDVTVRD